jgi:hypothetical protein
MTPDDLVERVADAIAEAWDREGRIIHAAEAAIATALEEAAKWLETAPPHLSMQEYAAAIRGMIKN